VPNKHQFDHLKTAIFNNYNIMTIVGKKYRDYWNVNRLSVQGSTYSENLHILLCQTYITLLLYYFLPHIGGVWATVVGKRKIMATTFNNGDLWFYKQPLSILNSEKPRDANTLLCPFTLPRCLCTYVYMSQLILTINYEKMGNSALIALCKYIFFHI